MRKKFGGISLLAMLVVLLLIALIPQAAQAATIHGDVYDLSLDRLTNVVVEVNTTPNQRIISKDGSYEFTLPIGSYKITAHQYRNNISIAKAEEFVQAVDDRDYVLDIFLYPDLEDVESLLNGTGKDEPPEKQETNLWALVFGIMLLALILAAALLFIPGIGKRDKRQGAGKNEQAWPGETRSEKTPTEKAAAEKPTSEKVSIGKTPIGKIIDEKSAEKIKGEKNPDENRLAKAPMQETGAGASSLEIDSDLKKVMDILLSEGGRTTQKEIRKHIPLSEAKVSLIITEMEAKGYIEKIKKGRGNIIILKKKNL